MSLTAHPSTVADVLVVGGGPAGTASAIQLADAGHRVTVVERNPARRPYGFGNVVSAHALALLDRLGVAELVDAHPIRGIRLTSGGHTSSVPWPDHPDLPDHAAVVRRNDFDAALLGAADDAGATVLTEHTATGPIVERGFVRGARVSDSAGGEFDLRATYTVVADGANSRFGRALGTTREQTWPWALAHSATFSSPLHTATEMELVLDLHDRTGNPITGAGWLLPTGDGTVNVGILLLSTSPSFKVINPAHLLEQFVEDREQIWMLDGPSLDTPASGRIPLGLSVGPAAGPTYLLVGDAVGAANPISGSGVDTALESGMLAATVLDDAIASESPFALQRYPQLLSDRFGGYYRFGRMTARLLGQPVVAARLGRLAASRPGVADVLARLVTRELRPGRGGVAEYLYRTGRAASVLVPGA
jgi:geranylgeranyl reductase family protein